MKDNILETFECLKLIRLLPDPKLRADFFSMVAGAHWLTFEEANRLAKGTVLYEPTSEFYIGGYTGLSKRFKMYRNCNSALKTYFPKCSKQCPFCSQCIFNANAKNKYKSEQDVLIAGVRSFGIKQHSLLQKIIFSPSFYVLGTAAQNLKIEKFELRKAIMENYLANPDISDVDLYSNIKQSASALKKDSIIDMLLSDCDRLIHKNVTEKEYQRAIGIFVGIPHNEKTLYLFPGDKPPQIALSDISSMNTGAGQQEKSKKSESVGSIKTDPVQVEKENGGTSNINDVASVLENDAVAFLKSQIDKYDNTDDSQVGRSTGTDTNLSETSYDYRKGVELNTSLYEGSCYVIETYDDIRALFSNLRFSTYVSAEIVSFDDITGLLLNGDKIDPAIYKSKPFFIRNELFSWQMFEALLKDAYFRVVTMNMELLMENARQYNVYRFDTIYSIRAALSIVNPEYRELYPLDGIKSICGIQSCSVHAPFINDIFNNYFLIREALIIKTDELRGMRRTRIMQRYENVLSTTSQIQNAFQVEYNCLERVNYFENRFKYMKGLNKIINGTVIDFYFDIPENDIDRVPMFFPNLLNQVFDSKPFVNIMTILLSYEKDRLTLFIKTTRKENINYATERIEDVVVNLCGRFKLGPPKMKARYY